MGKSIDDIVFRPLERRLLEKPFDEQGILDYVASHGLPPSLRKSGDESLFRGFVFELNMRLSISWVLDGVLYQMPEQDMRGNNVVIRTPYGAVVMFGDGDDAVEFDDLRELRVDGKIVPVIFEAKAGYGNNLGYKRRVSWVRQAFGEEPYFCVVRPKKPRGPEGLLINHALEQHRRIAIPTNGEVLAMAKHLMNCP